MLISVVSWIVLGTMAAMKRRITGSLYGRWTIPFLFGGPLTVIFLVIWGFLHAADYFSGFPEAQSVEFQQEESVGRTVIYSFSTDPYWELHSQI
jgi:hypothetical protein